MFIIKTEKILTYIDYTPQYKGFNVTEFGRETSVWTKNKAAEHRFNYILHFVLEGNGTFHRDNKTYKLYPGRAFVITPHNLVSYSPSKDSSYTYCWLAFSGTDCGAVFKACGISEDVAVFDFTEESIGRLKKFLERIENNKEAANGKAFAMEVYSMAYEVLANCTELLAPEATERAKESSSIVDEAVEYMQNNLDKPLNISSLCDKLGVSRAYFTTLFKKTLKQSPYKYLMNLRIQQAGELLISDKNLFIYTIAELVGFSSVEQFCKVFYKLNGCTPSEFRKRYVKKND